jgi:hypothetical protein
MRPQWLRAARLGQLPSAPVLRRADPTPLLEAFANDGFRSAPRPLRLFEGAKGQTVPSGDLLLHWTHSVYGACSEQTGRGLLPASANSDLGRALYSAKVYSPGHGYQVCQH